jgi:hypothetical protein
MPIVSVTRWKVGTEQAMPIARRGAPILKRHGATSVRVGPCHSGPDTGLFYVATTYPDWATYGQALQAQAADAEWQRVMAEAVQAGELQDRSLIVAEEL